MSNKEIFNGQMNELADTINERAGTTGKKTIPEMTEAVRNIPSGNSYTLELNPLMSQETLMAFAAFCTGWTDTEWDAWYFSNEQGEPVELDLTEYDQYDALDLHYELYGDEGEVVTDCTIPFRKQDSTNGEPRFVMNIIGVTYVQDISKTINVTLDSTGLIGVQITVEANGPEIDKVIELEGTITHNDDNLLYIEGWEDYWQQFDSDMVRAWIGEPWEEICPFLQDERFVVTTKDGKVYGCSAARGQDVEPNNYWYEGQYGNITFEATSESSADVSLYFTNGTNSFDIQTSCSVETDAETGDSRIVWNEITFYSEDVGIDDLDKMTIWRPLCNEHYSNAGGGGGGAVTSVNGHTGRVVLNAGDIGLDNVNNTSDMNKPVSTAVQAALNGKLDATSPVIIPGKTSGAYTNAAIRFMSDNIASFAVTKVSDGTSTFRLQIKGGDYGIISTDANNNQTVSLGDASTTRISFATGVNGNLTHARVAPGVWTDSNILDSYNTLANPILIGDEVVLTSLKLNDVSYKLPTTIANPTLIGGETLLTSISIDGTNYNIAKPFIVEFAKNANDEYVQGSGTVTYGDVLNRLNNGQEVIFKIFYQYTEENEMADYIAIKSWKDGGIVLTLDPVNIKAILGNYNCSGRRTQVIQIVPTNN